MNGKGKQFLPHGRHVKMAFPGGAGYGPPGEREREAVKRDLAKEYISEKTARETFGLTDEEICQVRDAVIRGDEI